MAKKAIGPSFCDELLAHGGLLGQHFSWSADGEIEFFEDTPEPVIEGVQAVYAAHDPTKASWESHQRAAQSALAESDNTVLRCYENGISLPTQWVAYRKELRAIVGAPSGDASQPLPTKPAYPVGS